MRPELLETLDHLRAAAARPGHDDREGRGVPVSGGELGRKLGITRAALWKRINLLREAGYLIDALPGRGYLLLEGPDLSAEEVTASLEGQGDDHFWHVAFKAETVSTNDDLMELAASGAPEGLVLIADRQTGGRGRMGRQWISPPGVNLHMSVLLRPRTIVKRAPLLTLLAAVAAADALGRETGLDLRIKWPNDLVIEGRKCGGILLEARSEADRLAVAVLGLGINVNLEPEMLPEELRETTTSLKTAKGDGKSLKRTPLAASLLRALKTELEAFYREGGAEALLDKWRRRAETLGRRVDVREGGNVLSGVAEDIDEDGRLLLRLESGELRPLSSAQVSLQKEKIG